MKIFITFTNLEHTESLDKHIHDRSQKLERFWNGVGELHWTCFINNGRHKAEVKCLGGKWNYQASAEGHDMYRSILQAVAKLEKQLARDKDKIKNKMHREVVDLVINDPQDAWGDYEAQKEEEAERVVNLADYRKRKITYEEKKKKKTLKLALKEPGNLKKNGQKALAKEEKAKRSTSLKSKKILRIPKRKIS